MQNKSVTDLIAEAAALHNLERSLTLKSTLLVGQLEMLRASLRCGLSTADFAVKIGLTADTYWKRAQAARVLRVFPETRAMVERGETTVSVVAMLATQLTQANSSVILSGIKHKSKRAVKELLSVVTADGQIIEREPTVDIKLTLTKSQMEKLDRAKDILAAAGHNPSLDEVILKAVDELIQRRDQLEKAARAARRLSKKQETMRPEKVTAPDPDQEGHARQVIRGVSSRPPVPSAVRHQVWLRDQGQCAWRHADGKRCSERRMLELDHQRMVCRGGEHGAENLRLRCRFHNQVQAEIPLGCGYMEYKRAAANYRGVKYVQDDQAESEIQAKPRAGLSNPLRLKAALQANWSEGCY